MVIETKFNHGQRVQGIVQGQESYIEKCPVCEGNGYFLYKDRKIDCSESGCWGEGYTIYSGDLKQGEIKDLMPDIRNIFTWGQNYNEKNERLPETIYKPLKDLTTSHISGIIRYILEKSTCNEQEQYFIHGKQIMAILLIFTYELENRLKDGKEI